MMNNQSKITFLEFCQNDIVLEYSEKIIRQLIDKFKENYPQLDDNTIRHYINRFDAIKQSPRIENKDITQYTWNDLEHTVDSFAPKRKKRVKAADTEGDDLAPPFDPIFSANEGKFNIFKAEDPWKACQVRRYFDKKDFDFITGQNPAGASSSEGGLGWCVSRPIDKANLYTSYAGPGKDFASFYLIEDQTRNDSWKYSALAILKDEPGHNMLHITDIKNGYQQYFNSIDDLADIYPHIVGAKEVLKRHTEGWDDDLTRMIDDNVSPAEFKTLSDKYKDMYLSMGKPIYLSDFKKLDYEGKRAAINAHQNSNNQTIDKFILNDNNSQPLAPLEILEFLKKEDTQLYKRYLTLLNRNEKIKSNYVVFELNDQIVMVEKSPDNMFDVTIDNKNHTYITVPTMDENVLIDQDGRTYIGAEIEKYLKQFPDDQKAQSVLAINSKLDDIVKQIRKNFGLDEDGNDIAQESINIHAMKFLKTANKIIREFNANSPAPITKPRPRPRPNTRPTERPKRPDHPLLPTPGPSTRPLATMKEEELNTRNDLKAFASKRRRR